MPLGFSKTKTETINGDGATVTYRAELPSSLLQERYSFTTPLVMSDGLWPMARGSAGGQRPLVPPAVPELSAADLAAQVGALELKLAGALRGRAPAGQDIQLFLGRDLFLALGDRIRHLPPDKRRVTARVPRPTVVRDTALQVEDGKEVEKGRGGWDGRGPVGARPRRWRRRVHARAPTADVGAAQAGRGAAAVTG